MFLPTIRLCSEARLIGVRGPEIPPTGPADRPTEDRANTAEEGGKESLVSAQLQDSAATQRDERIADNPAVAKRQTELRAALAGAGTVEARTKVVTDFLNEPRTVGEMVDIGATVFRAEHIYPLLQPGAATAENAVVFGRAVRLLRDILHYAADDQSPAQYRYPPAQFQQIEGYIRERGTLIFNLPLTAQTREGYMHVLFSLEESCHYLAAVHRHPDANAKLRAAVMAALQGLQKRANDLQPIVAAYLATIADGAERTTWTTNLEATRALLGKTSESIIRALGTP